MTGRQGMIADTYNAWIECVVRKLRREGWTTQAAIAEATSRLNRMTEKD